jgi:hypothetical protein
MTVDNDDRLGELAQWVTDANTRAGTADVGPPKLVHTWHSRTATLHQFSWSVASVPDVVVKLHRTADEAEAHFQSMRYVAQALEDARPHGVAVIRPVDVSLDLKAVSMPFVDGESLSNQLVEGNWSSKTAREDIHALVNRCGVLLASYHSYQPEAGAGARQQAANRLRTRIERALERSVDLAQVPAVGPVVRCYRDFHPGHVIVTLDGKLALIDPPIETRYDYFYRDLALFSHSLFMSLIKPHGMLRNPLRTRHWASLSQAFLHGYATATNRSLTEDDMFYVRGWEAFYLARMLGKARRRRSYALMAYYYAPMRHRLRGLRRTLTRHLKDAGQSRTRPR